jgi:enamine deaminase RidA (YjgF/YER057c/UK114 family)
MSSSQREVVSTTKASKPNPTLSQATIRNGFVFCGGVLGTDPETGALVEGTIGDRTVSRALAERHIEYVLIDGPRSPGRFDA